MGRFAWLWWRAQSLRLHGQLWGAMRSHGSGRSSHIADSFRLSMSTLMPWHLRFAAGYLLRMCPPARLTSSPANQEQTTAIDIRRRDEHARELHMGHLLCKDFVLCLPPRDGDAPNSEPLFSSPIDVLGNAHRERASFGYFRRQTYQKPY